MKASTSLERSPLPNARLFIRQWQMLGLCLLLAAVSASSWLVHERAALRQHETDKLQGLVQTLDSIVGQQMIAIQATLKTIELQRHDWRAASRQADAEPLFRTLSRSMPGVRHLLLVDREGHVLASSEPRLVGMDARHRDYFKAPRAAPQGDRLYLSPPFQSVLGVYTLTLSRALFDADGQFDGVVVASLDPDYFGLVLETAQPAQHTWAALAHTEGLIFSARPHDPAWVGRNLLDAPQSILAQHLAQGSPASLHLTQSRLSGDERLVAAHTVQASGVNVDRPLVVAVGRALDAIEAPWRRQVAAVALLGSAIAAATVLALLLWQRRQRWVDELQAQRLHHEQDSAERLALALEGAALGLWDWDLTTQVVQFDTRWCAMLGLRKQDMAPHADSWQERLHPEDAPRVLEALHDYLAGAGEQFTQEFRLRHRDGHWVWVHSNGRIMARDAQGQALRMIGTHLDISAARQAEQQLQAQAQHTQAILDHMVDGMITIDAQGVVRSINPSACRMFGYEAHEVLGQRVNMLMPEPDRSRHDDYVGRAVHDGLDRVIGIGRDVQGQRKDGTIFPMSLAVSRIEQNGQPLFIGLTRDITERKQSEAAIEKLAFYDPLTALPNRRLLLDRLSQSLAANRRKHGFGAVVFIDMDNFKSLNDTLGHGIGDRLLQSVAQRLQQAIRAEDTVARWGGDEFVVLLQDLGLDRGHALQRAEAAAEKLLRVLGQPYLLGELSHHSTPSIGIVLWGDADTNADELLKHADHAMYQAKAGGRNQLRFFDPVTQAALAERSRLEADLREAVNQQHFELYYQAQVNSEGRIVGAETLLRWRHAERGWVSPALFVPLAEQTGLISPLGEWVLQQACVQLNRWSTDPALSSLSLAVNLSAHQFRQKGFLSFMQQLLARSHAPTDMLKLELTESALVDDVEAAITLMDQLRELGLHFSLDDFGTGYSSLSYLKRLPLKQLKIDQSFVRDLVDEPNARAIARAVVHLGESLGLDVIAEGVETTAQRDALLELHCLAYQGYLFSRPLPLADFEALARQGLNST